MTLATAIPKNITFASISKAVSTTTSTNSTDKTIEKTIPEWLERGMINSQQYQERYQSGSWDDITTFCKETVGFFKTAGETLEKIIWCFSNPFDALGKLWDGIVACSFWTAVLSVVILILYNTVADNPKSKRWIAYIILTYILIKAINLVI